MKQKVEVAARSCSIKAGYNPESASDIVGQTVYETGFKNGANWMLQQLSWIKVEDRLPKEKSSVFFIVQRKDFKGYYVGLYNGNGCWESDWRIFLPESPLGKVTYWMSIPDFDMNP